MIIRNYTYALGLIKLFIYKLFFGKRLQFDLITKFDHRGSIRIRPRGKIILSKRCGVGRGALVRVTQNAVFELGKNSGLNSYCVITCREKISIGENVLIGSNVSMYDHDHIYKTDGLMKKSGFVSAPIVIEDNVWIGANVTILKGVTIGAGSVVAAGTVVTKDIPANSVVYNKRDCVIKSKFE